MAAKPSNAARWAETAGGSAASNITEPSSGQKDTGWTTSEIPPSSYQNWWQRTIYTWIKYLRDAVFVGEAGLSGIDATGGTGNTTGVVGTGVGTGPGVSGNGGSNGNGVTGMGNSAGNGGVFTSGTGAAVAGVIGNGGAAGIPGGKFVAGAAASGGTPRDAVEAADGYVHVNATAPNATTGVTNRLTPTNIPKAWGTLQTDGAGGVTITDGFNVASVNLINTTDINVVIADNMADANYAVLLSIETDSSFDSAPRVQTGTRAVTGFVIEGRWYNAVQTPFQTKVATVFFVVFGRQ